MILNPANYCIPHRHRSLGPSTRQSLSNFEPWKPWKYKPGQSLTQLDLFLSLFFNFFFFWFLYFFLSSFLPFFLSFFLYFLLQNYSKSGISIWNFQLFSHSSLGKSICLGLVAELLTSFFWHMYIKSLGTWKRKYKFFKYLNISGVFRFLLSAIEAKKADRRKRRKWWTAQSTLLEKQINKCHGLKLSFR